QLKGNIYLAKVTRVEPSLQAAFVDYGGNRHGFLAFSEIHPDYYQIPKEDRDALLREEAEHAAQEAALRAEQDEQDEGDDDDGDSEDTRAHHDDGDHDSDSDSDTASEGEDAPRRRRASGGDDVDALRERRMNLRRRYKIQDVIRRRQVLLVQVVKEERGNKGAALTTYLSLAGRYCVLMPNTSHGGGISRKISNAADRKRLKAIMADLKLPSSMGCIVRTAGLQRTKVEIKRDFDYLARLWDEVREKTLASAAPALVHGDSDLIKRAIRDIYNKDIDEVIVEGDEGYAQAKQFMRLLMPSHARRVKHYSDPVPLFQRSNVEDQLAAMYHPVVQLKSGGYLVINPTEALVSIDINSGRSTREHNIEQTATATNLEAAQEIARQLRLRDMAGLVVIDFIDMDNNSNVRKVEKAMKEAMKNDRARIQVGRISSFGLMEMSRQRLRTGVLEASTRPCPHCEGSGFVRTASSAGLSALRLIEDEAARGRGSIITLRASQEAAFYLLNRKRAELAEIEERYGVTVEVLSDGEREGARMAVEASGPPPAHTPRFAPAFIDVEDDADEVEEELDEAEDAEDSDAELAPRDREERGGEGRDGPRRKRRRRRGRRGRSAQEGGDIASEPPGEDVEGLTDDDAEPREAGEEAAPRDDERGDGEGGGRRRRGRRGRRGRRNDRVEGDRIEGDLGDVDTAIVPADTDAPLEHDAEALVAEGESAPAETDEAPPPRARRSRARVKTEAEAEPDTQAATPPVADAAPDPAVAAPKRTRRKKADTAVTELVETSQEADTEPAKPKRRATRKKAAEEPVAAAPVAESAPVADTAPASPDDTAPPADADAAPDASADVVPEAASADVSAAQAAAPTAAEPPRRGWWQRTFGA
ncbi:MAG: ribonuclease E/G, partial [Sphingobium sp.]|nr:ribonuclease E/G [Sphingobium sp.]